MATRDDPAQKKVKAQVDPTEPSPSDATDFECLRALVDEDGSSRGGRALRMAAIIGVFVAGGGLWLWAPQTEEIEPELALEARVQNLARSVEPEAEPLPARAPTEDGEEDPAGVEDVLGSDHRTLPPGVARAVTVVFSDGRQVGRGRHFDVRLTRRARLALRSVGVRVPPRRASAAVRESALVRGLGRLAAELGSLEAGLACLRVPKSLVETALDLAFGSNLPTPDRFESFARYLPPAARRRAEGPIRHVMALAIGYGMQWPVPESVPVSSGFGMRFHPVLGQPMWHAGTDLAVDPGTPIWAMADGHVVYSRSDRVNGRFVKIDHGYGLTSAYVHNSRLLVTKGEQIKRGQIIALSGATGRATGPHLHFQVELDNRPIDPESFRERKAPRAHRQSIEAEAIGEADIPGSFHHHH